MVSTITHLHILTRELSSNQEIRSRFAQPETCSKVLKLALRGCYLGNGADKSLARLRYNRNLRLWTSQSQYQTSLYRPPTSASDVCLEVLEAYPIESYRQEKMSVGQVAEMLELSISETHAFLKDHNLRLNYDLRELERDSGTIERFLNK